MGNRKEKVHPIFLQIALFRVPAFLMPGVHYRGALIFKTYYTLAVFLRCFKKKGGAKKPPKTPNNKKTKTRINKKNPKPTTKKNPKTKPKQQQKNPYHSYFCLVHIFLSCLVVSKPIFFHMHFVTPEHFGRFLYNLLPHMKGFHACLPAWINVQYFNS